METDNLPEGVFVAGNGLYAECGDCGKIVKLNKWLFGGLHNCVSTEKIARTQEQKKKESEKGQK